MHRRWLLFLRRGVVSVTVSWDGGRGGAWGCIAGSMAAHAFVVVGWYILNWYAKGIWSSFTDPCPTWNMRTERCRVSGDALASKLNAGDDTNRVIMIVVHPVYKSWTSADCDEVREGLLYFGHYSAQDVVVYVSCLLGVCLTPKANLLWKLIHDVCSL